MRKYDHMNRLPGGSVRRGVDAECITGGDEVFAVGTQIRIDGRLRILVIVKVKAPVKKSCNIVPKELYADDAVSCGGHGKEAVGDLIVLTAAIIGP